MSAVAHPATARHAVAAPFVATTVARPIAVAEYVGPSTTAATASTTTATTKAKGHRAKKVRRAKPTLTAAAPALVGATTPTGKTPAQMRAAYGLGVAGSAAISYPVTFGAVAGDGAGQTIAILDAYDDPNAVSDLHNFSAYFGLPDAPSFQVLNEFGSATSLPSADPNGANYAGGTWEEEESLDVEWAHVMAPRANLILYEADAADFDDLEQADVTAAANPAVTVVSMSYGAGEYFGETDDDANYTTPASRAGGVTFLASTGDGGPGTEAPSTSPNVVAVGGTSLAQSAAGGYGSESPWSGSGGGVSALEAQPAYQAATVAAFSTTMRTVPDVAMDADPHTGVPIYDSYDFGTATPWLGGGYVEGGTSLACPLWAGVVAVADQGRAAEGLPSLYSETGTLTRLYQLPGTDFHDVTAVANGTTTDVGYDLATGRGSPVANTLIPDLAGAATVTGRVYVDADGDGTFDHADTPVANQSVYLDLNNDGVLDNGEPSTTTDATGTYTFADQPGGGTVRLASVPAGYAAVPTNTSATVAYGATDTADLALFPTAYSTTAAGARYTLQTNAAGTVAQVLFNGTLTDSVALSSLPSLSFTLGGRGDTLTVDGATGDPLPAGGLTVTGTAGQADALLVVGTPGADALAVSAAAVTFSSVPISYSNLSAVSVDPGGGTDSLAVTGGSPTVPAGTAGGGLLARPFSALSVAAGATLTFATPAAHADRQVVVTSALSVAGTLDLGGNDMVVHGGSLSTASALAATGFAGGAWTGPGLASSAAAADATHRTALGVIQSPGTGTFDGQAVTAADVLVKYTYYGDANLDGVVTAADYLRTDVGYVTAATGWANGDFNDDGVVDGSDYTLVDNAFDTETAAL